MSKAFSGYPNSSFSVKKELRGDEWGDLRNESHYSNQSFSVKKELREGAGEQNYCFWSRDGRRHLELVNISFLEEQKQDVIADILWSLTDFNRMADCSLVDELLWMDNPLEADGNIETCPETKPELHRLVCDRTRRRRRQGRMSARYR